MAGKPYQSLLVPHEQEIRQLRSRRPPMPYAQIVEHLRQKHGLTIQRAAIFKFVKVRSRGRKVYCFARKPELASKNCQKEILTACIPLQKPSSPQTKDPWDAIERLKQEAKARSQFRKQPLLKTFTPSNQYNLTRLSPEEAEAFKKKLSQEIEKRE
jgi:hypothetical protein